MALLRADYEQLRADALSAGGQGWRWGRALLARAGLAVWLTTWSEHAAANVKSHQPAPRAPATLVGDTEPLVSVLALMLLACTKSNTDPGVAA